MNKRYTKLDVNAFRLALVEDGRKLSALADDVGISLRRLQQIANTGRKTLNVYPYTLDLLARGLGTDRETLTYQPRGNGGTTHEGV